MKKTKIYDIIYYKKSVVRGGKMTNKEAMEYAIHSNELAGHVFTEEEIEFLMSVAEGKITVEKAIEEIKNR